MVGAKDYSLMSNFVAPEKPSTKSYAELVAAMKVHLNPLTIAERFKFHRQNQR